MPQETKQVHEEVQVLYDAKNQQASPDQWPAPKPRLTKWSAVRKGARGPVIGSPEAAEEYLKSLIAGLDKEVFIVLCLDHQNQLVYAEYSPGTVDQVGVYPREVLNLALDKNATGIILSHNHPAGSLAPSEGDKQMTRQIVTAARALGIAVHDHIIVTNEGRFSFRQSGLL